MGRTIMFFFGFALSLFLTTFLLPLWHIFRWLGFSKLQRALSHRTSYYWSRFLLLISGAKVKVHGMQNLPEEGPILFISNHQGNFDIPILLGHINRPKAFLAKKELKKIPVIYSWMRKMDCVFIDRADIRQSLQAINKCVEVLKNGQSVVIFPEGTRSRGPVMGPFKKGSLRPIEKARVPVVPITIKGSYKLMEANANLIRPAEVEVLLSPPIYPGDIDVNDKDTLEKLIRQAIEKPLNGPD